MPAKSGPCVFTVAVGKFVLRFAVIFMRSINASLMTSSDANRAVFTELLQTAEMFYVHSLLVLACNWIYLCLVHTVSVYLQVDRHVQARHQRLSGCRERRRHGKHRSHRVLANYGDVPRLKQVLKEAEVYKLVRGHTLASAMGLQIVGWRGQLNFLLCTSNVTMLHSHCFWCSSCRPLDF